MKALAVALFVSLCAVLAPSAIAADEPLPAANILDKLVGEWQGTLAGWGVGTTTNVVIGISKTGGEYPLVFNSSGSGKSISTLKVVEGKLKAELPPDYAEKRELFLDLVDDKMNARLVILYKGAQREVFRTGEFTKKKK